VVGDHGQLLGERGFVGHGFTLDEELIRIPLIVKGLPSSGLAHHEYAEQVQISDVFTVILELAGLRPSGAGSLTHSIASGEPFRTLTFASYHQPARPEVTSLRRWVSETLEAVRTDSTKIVRDAEGHVTTYRVDGATQVLVPSSAIGERLLAELQAKHLEIAPARAGALLPLPGDITDRLRALGYIH
jgi:arylsulfatase A-like enzyme